jgi:hypothetical protein
MGLAQAEEVCQHPGRGWKLPIIVLFKNMTTDIVNDPHPKRIQPPSFESLLSLTDKLDGMQSSQKRSIASVEEYKLFSTPEVI